MKLNLKIITFLLVCAISTSIETQAQEATLGEVKMFAGNFAPRGWALCEGQLLPINQYQALFSLLGTMYGGDGRTTFALPDLRGRAPISPGNGPGLSSFREGQKGGSEYNILTVNQLPAHFHNLATGTVSTNIGVNSEAGESSNPNGEFLAAGNDIYIDEAGTNQFLGGVSSSLSGNTTNTGANQQVNNRPPYLAINYIIALQGVFPSRN